MLTRTIKRQDEEFTVKVTPDEKNTTVTDERATQVTITPDSGNFSVRLPNGWGAWKPSMESSVDYAVQLCFEARKQLTAGEARREMVEYVEGKDTTESPSKTSEDAA